MQKWSQEKGVNVLTVERDAPVSGGKAKATKAKAKATKAKAKPKAAHVKTARKDAAGRVIYRSVKTGADVVRRKGPAGAKMVWRKASTQSKKKRG